MRISQAAQQMLDGTILPFWLGLRDEENGGFYGYLDFDLNLDKKAEKGCILNSRILWFLASLPCSPAVPFCGMRQTMPSAS